MGEIRLCNTEDIPTIAQLFQNGFRDKRHAASSSLEAYLRELFFEHVWHDPDLASRVYVGIDGRIHGFMGVLPVRMLFHGQPLKAALGSSLVVDNPAEHPLAGARLFRSYLTGPQQLCVSETSNSIAQGMWLRSGGYSIADYSMEWLRVLRPAGFGAAMLQDLLSAAKMLRPITSTVDATLEWLKKNPFACQDTVSGHYSDVDAADEEIIEHIPHLTAPYALRPDWDQGSLAFVLRHAARKSRHGKLYRRIIYNRGRTPVGCYLYYLRPRSIGWVLQILALPESVDMVTSCMMAHAWKQGAVALRGRTQPNLLNTLLRNRCILFQRSSTTIYAKNSDLIAAIRSGDALVGGLAGERWTRLIGDDFRQSN
jgi:hypothetical protein